MLTKSLQNLCAKTLQAVDDARKLLFSYTEKIENIDPIVFLNLHQRIFKGERFFWKSPDQKKVIVGLGIARSFSNDANHKRYELLEEEWAEQLRHALIHNPYDIPGTGPLLFGGFSFDPNSKKEEKWHSFRDTLFYLPRFMLTSYNQECYLTVNILGKEKHDSMYDHVKELINELMDGDPISTRQEPAVLTKETPKANKWLHSVNEVIDELNESPTVEKVVLARMMKVGLKEGPELDYLIERLAEQQRDSFIFAMESADSCFLGASPERLVKKQGSEVYSTCLAGSIGRSKDDQEDVALGEALLNDEKNLYEHALVVDMVRDALDPSCMQLQIPEQPVLLKTDYIQHLYTPVSGIAKEDTSIFHLVERLHPTPALGGVPTDRALEIIRDKEEMDRGFYAAPIGWSDYRGNGEFVVAIRSGLIKSNELFLYAGCGLVSDSDPAEELVETDIKFQPMLKAIGGKRK